MHRCLRISVHLDVSAPPHTENQRGGSLLGLFSKGDVLLGPDHVV
jgi:hypothetical protein